MKTAWIVVLVAAACGGKKSAPEINPLSDVSGRWQLNAQQSDDAAGKIAAGIPGRDRSAGSDSAGAGDRGGSGSGGFGGMGGGGGATGRWGGGGRGGRGGMRGRGRGGATRQMDAQELARRRERMDLTVYLAQYGSEDLDVRLSPGAARFISHGMLDTLAVKTDGSNQKTTIPQGDDDVKVTTTATWVDGWLVVTRDVDGGGKITETYLRSSDGQHLYVVVQLALPRGGRASDDGKPRVVEFRRVYDPVTGG